MKVNNKISILILLILFQGCSRSANELYSKRSVDDIQKHCEDSVKSWIIEYATFPKSYIPLLFEKVRISSTHNKSVEIIPLRRYTLEHTFEIRNKEFKNTHATLVFELTPDYFIQDVRYKKEGVVSLVQRVFPPKYQLWTEFYGRALTIADTLKWNEHNRALLFQLSEKFTFNRYIDPGGENAILTDSLVRQLNSVYRKNSSMP